MNPQFSYVDSNYSCVNVARPNDMCTVSANPNSYYVQKPVQDNLHASANPSSYYGQRPMQDNPYDSTFSSNLQHVDLNSHASVNPSSYYVQKPMDNMLSSFNQYETPDLGNFNSMQSSVSSPYSSANNLQYVAPLSNVPTDRELGDAIVSYLTGYSQPAYTAPYLNTESAAFATDIRNSAYLQDDGRISEDSARAHMPDYNTMAYNTSPAQFQNLVNPWQEEIKCDTPSYNQLGDHTYRAIANSKITHRVVVNSGTKHTELQPTRKQPRPEDENLQRKIDPTM